MSSHSQPSRSGLGCLVALLVGVSGLGLAGLMLALALGGGSTTGDVEILEVVEDASKDAESKLAVIELVGLLFDGPSGFDRSPGITRDALAMLDRAAEDDHVVGVLLYIDTPGGSVTDADLIHRRVRQLRDKGKPVVVLMGDVCASGGYYIAVGASTVLALPTSVTGSIGVIISSLNVAELLSRWGVIDTSIASGPNKALMSPTKPVDPAHKELLETIVRAMYDRFVKLVAEGRKLDVAVVRELADGRLFTADQAKELGLVDEIGYRDDALDALRGLAKKGPYTIVRYQRRPPSIADIVRLQVSTGSSSSSPWSGWWPQVSTPRALYLFGR